LDLRLEDRAVKGCVEEVGELVAVGRSMQLPRLHGGLEAVRHGTVDLVVDFAQALSDRLAVLTRLGAEVSNEAALPPPGLFQKAHLDVEPLLQTGERL